MLILKPFLTKVAFYIFQIEVTRKCECDKKVIMLFETLKTQMKAKMQKFRIEGKMKAFNNQYKHLIFFGNSDMQI
jgi:hypothetical protein